MPTVVSLVGACGLRIVWVLTVFQTFPTFAGLFLCYPVTWIITFLAHAVCAKFAEKKITGLFVTNKSA
jgi:hypothetical protein